MATLVLTAVGTVLGGPIGGAIGGMLGQAIDGQIFGPAARQGPRLGDLSVQTSSYGTPIPRVYGSMRVAGTVVWATDLIEQEDSEGGGKGSPEVTTYSYSVSLAVALSSRQAVSVRRIWADGKLLRGLRGDLKSRGRFRFHPGSESQPVDPLIASIEGAGKAPAYRGLALAVFEDLALADFGNRIPMLTFELIADSGEVGIAEVINDVSRQVIGKGPGAGAGVTGYAAHGGDQRGAVDQLVNLFGIDLDERDGALAVRGAAPALAVGERASRDCSERRDRSPGDEERRQAAARTLPASLTLTYYDPARDFQAGQARALIAGGGRTEWRVDCPVALAAVAAKRVANDAMARQWAEREQIKLRLDPSYLAVAPGDLLAIADRAGQWLVHSVTIDALVVVVEAVRWSGASQDVAAEPGRPVSEPDEEIGATRLALVDLPFLGSGWRDKLALWAAASSEGAFRPVPLQASVNGQPLAGVTLARRAVLGVAEGPLATAPATLIDTASSVDVVLVDPGAVMLNADDDALVMGANLALLGGELIQFGRAEPVEPGRYRLSRLLRGRRGSDWAIGAHQAGETFLLIDPASLAMIEVDAAMRGASVTASAFGVADDPTAPPTATRIADGENLRPLAPVRLDARDDGGGGLVVSWVERSRDAYAWVDGVGGASEVGTTFDIDLVGSAGSWRGTGIASPVSIDAATVATLGAGPAIIRVTAFNQLARARPAEHPITL